MSLVNIIHVTVLDNPTAFTNPFQFEITFECLQELQDDLEWKVIYVGNAEDANGDQVLEEVMVGPVPVGVNKFVLQASPPDHSLIANNDLIGVTVVLVTCSFMDQEFVRIGYYVNNEYSEEYDPEHPPNPVEVAKLYRNILADQPRVTRFNIDWTGGNGANAMPMNESVMAEGDENQNPNDNEEDIVIGGGCGEGNENENEEEEEDDEEEDEEEGDDEIEVDLEDEEEDGDDASGDEKMQVINEDSMDVMRMQQDFLSSHRLY